MPGDVMSISETAAKEPQARYDSLDYIRGLSIFGILFVNAISFAQPFMVYAGMPSPVPMTATDHWADWAIDSFAHSKFITIFSLLFGVSVFLVGKSYPADAKGFNTPLFRRLFWLLIFGLVHGMIIWLGDVLLLYALSGMIMIFLRNRSASTLLISGGTIYALFSILPIIGVIAMALMPEASEAARGGMGKPADLAPLIEQMRSGLAGSLQGNFKQWLSIAPFASVFYITVTVPLMMIGLGLFKTGFLKGTGPVWVYGLVAAVGLINLAALAYVNWAIGHRPDLQLASDIMKNGPPIFISLAYVSLILLFIRSPLGQIVLYPLKCAGQMAFTNYLCQSLVMTALFYGGRFPFPQGSWPREALAGAMGHDLPWYGLFNEGALVGICATLVVIQLIVSVLWMQVFRYGPFEWGWRCLTHRTWVGILKRSPQPRPGA